MSTPARFCLAFSLTWGPALCGPPVVHACVVSRFSTLGQEVIQEFRVNTLQIRDNHVGLKRRVNVIASFDAIMTADPHLGGASLQLINRATCESVNWVLPPMGWARRAAHGNVLKYRDARRRFSPVARARYVINGPLPNFRLVARGPRIDYGLLGRAPQDLIAVVFQLSGVAQHAAAGEVGCGIVLPHRDDPVSGVYTGASPEAPGDSCVAGFLICKCFFGSYNGGTIGLYGLDFYLFNNGCASCA